MGQRSPMNKVVKWVGIVGMLANKAQKRQRCEKWAKEALSKRLMKKWARTAGALAHKPTG